MSNNVTLGSANIVITATNRIGAGLDSAATQLSAFTKVVAQNWWGVKNLGLAFAALPAAVTAGVALSVRAAAEWESSMVDVQRTTTGFTAAGTEAFKTIEAGLKDLASSTPIPIKDLAQIASAAGALGVRSEDVLKFTKTVVNLSQTTDLSAQQASVALARIAALTGLTADQYDNLASSILKTGQETAATEQEIVAIATRLAGAAGVIGLTSDEVIGISAALASAGVKSEAAGTAMIQTFLRMQQAVLDNGAALDKWAAIAGQSAGDFATAFQNDPGQAIAMVVKGLGTLNGGMATAAIRLNDVGITGRREKQALLGLAVAESQTGNESLKLSNILVKSREGMLDSELAADLAARKFHTFSGQVATLHNQIQILSIGFGKHVLPVLEPMVSLFQNFINVITMLPGPVKAAFGVVLGLLTVFTGLGALILLIGPRFLILIDGANKIFKAFTAAATGVNLQTQALQANTVAANQNAAAQNAAAAAASGAGGTGAAAGGAAGATKTVQPRLPNGRLGKGVQVPVGAQVPAGATADDLEKLAAGEAAVGEEAVVAGTAVAGFGTKVLGIVSSIGALVVVLGAVTGLINLFGNKTKLQAKAAEDAAKANHELVGILSDQKKATEGAADAWIMHQSAMQGAIGVGAKLGLSTDNLLKIIKGTANDAERKDFFAKVADGAKRGVPQVDLFKDAMARLNLTFQTSAKDANSVIRGNGKIIGTQEEVSAFMEQEEENTKKAIQARLDYIEAGRSLHDANISVRDALESYKDALSEAKLKADRLTGPSRKPPELSRRLRRTSITLDRTALTSWPLQRTLWPRPVTVTLTCSTRSPIKRRRLQNCGPVLRSMTCGMPRTSWRRLSST
jgi:TP901 family phage tail tape measure protein